MSTLTPAAPTSFAISQYVRVEKDTLMLGLRSGLSVVIAVLFVFGAAILTLIARQNLLEAFAAYYVTGLALLYISSRFSGKSEKVTGYWYSYDPR